MLLFLSCHTSKPTINQVDVDALNTLLNSRQFHIESHMAYPQVTMAMQQVLSAGVLGPGNMAGSISLIGNENFLKISGEGKTKTFTVRKISSGVGVERIFPYFSPYIESIEHHKKGKVRRAKLYYLRALVGKKARIKEKLGF